MLKKINILEYQSLLILCSLSSSLGISLYYTVKFSSIDSYIAILIGNIIGFIPLFIFIYIFNYEEDKSLDKKIISLFEKKIGKVISIILSILFFILASTILYNISNFIVSQYLSDTNIIYIMILFGIVLYTSLNKGIETISRISFIFTYIFFFLFLLAVISIINEIDLDNIKPFLEYGIKDPLLSGMANSLIATTPIYSLLMIPKKDIIDKEKSTKYIIIGYIISSIILFLIAFISNVILGKYLIGIYQYPGYISLKKASLFKFVGRIENFFSLGWILSSFITISSSLYFTKENITKNNKLHIPLIIILIIFTYNIFNNTTSFDKYILYTYPYLLLIIFFIFLIISIMIMYKKKKST